MTLIGAPHCTSQLRNIAASIHRIRFASSGCTGIIRRSYGNSLWTKVAAVSGFSAAGLWLYFNHAHCASTSREARSAATPPRPFKSIKLYQYRFSPYCSKTRAFVEYYGIPHETVELNPLWKRRMAFTSSKIPVAEVDGEKMDDSSLIISVLHTCMVTGKSIRDALLYYPEMAVTNSKGTSVNERVNKYVVMYNETPDALQLIRRREEREWREWVDSKLVVAVVPNMFRTLHQSLRCFDYTREVTTFNPLERLAVKYIGGVVMFCIGKYMKRKHQLSFDVRRDLYQCCHQWVCAVASNGRFMGGENPCLADLVGSAS